jgi:peptidoglycan lytic transglycosylase
MSLLVIVHPLKKNQLPMKRSIRSGLITCLVIPIAAFGREGSPVRDTIPPGGHHPKPVKRSPAHLAGKPPKVQYGTASYYANKFEGRKTYTDEIFHQDKLTAASNTLPMHTWVRVTNLRNQRSVIVRINDKMHPHNKRLIDLSHAAADRLGYTGRGLTKVRIDVLGKKRPADAETAVAADK